MTATPVGTESTLVIAPMIAVLVAAVGTLLLGRHSRARAAVSLAGGAGYAIAVAAIDWYIILAPDAPGIATYQVGDWPAPFGITLVADGLSAFMLTMVAILGVASLVFRPGTCPAARNEATTSRSFTSSRWASPGPSLPATCSTSSSGSRSC